MPPKKAKQTIDLNAEDKIKTAARTVFHKKGFAATRTRDIALEADMNLALLNYYFKSKEKLFDLIMLETLAEFLNKMSTVFNDENSSLDEKVQSLAERYIDMLISEPEIPIFILNEMRNDAKRLLAHMPVANTILQSVFIKQYMAGVKSGQITEPNPLHFLMNLMGMMVFPFVSAPLVKEVSKLKDKQFEELMQERKARIPIWVKAMLQAR